MSSGVATIFGPPRKQLVWAPGQGVMATASSWWAPGGPLRAPSAPRAPPRSRGLRGPRYATADEMAKQNGDKESLKVNDGKTKVMTGGEG